MAAPQPAAQQQQGRQLNNGYIPNGSASGPVPGAVPLLPNQGRILQNGPTRILCVADVRGDLKSLNTLARDARADYIIHTGDFGFYDERSLDRIAEKTLKHVIQYSPLIGDDVRRQAATLPPGTSIKDRFRREQLPLSQLPYFLNNTFTFDVPVYSVWGACEDVQVLEKLRSGEYKIDKLHIIDEAHSRLLDVGGVKLRLLGLGGAVVMHKLFDNGEGRTTIAGGQGTMWTTLLQMGELVDTANRVYDPSETRILVTHASPAREGLLNQLSVTLKADFSVSAGLHFRYGSSYNEFSVNPTLDHYRGKLAASQASFNDVWETVKSEVEPAVADNEAQQKLLQNALEIVSKMPKVANSGNPFGGGVGNAGGQVDESAFKNMWNFNLADAAFGWLILEVDNGRIGTEMKAQGFNFAHRGMKNPVLQAEMIKPAQPATQQVSPGTLGQTGATKNPSPAGNVPPAGMPPGSQSRPNQPPSRPGVAATTTASVAPVRQSENAASKPVTGPAAKSVNGTPTEARANGTGALASEDASKRTPPPAERKPSSAIFITGANSEEEVRALFTEEDRAKIQRIESNKRAFVVHFSSPDEMQAALKTALEAQKKSTATNKPMLKEYQERPPYRSNQSSAGTWGSNQRGGSQQSGYRSGGASDSEGGRGGRGSFRARGGRGGDRGGRGGRGGRGSFNKVGGDGSGPAASSPAGASTPSGN